MKILYEFKNTSDIYQAFDLENISKELESKYDIEVNFLPERSLDAQHRFITAEIRASKNGFSLYSDIVAKCYLIVNSSNKTAFAISRGGRDKAINMLLPSVCNKHVKSPFKVDTSIRNIL